MNDLVKKLKRNQGKFLPIVPDVEIDDRILIDCPATLPKLRFASKACPDCEHFDGIALMSHTDDGIKLSWDVEFCIRCRYPMERAGRIILIADEHQA